MLDRAPIERCVRFLHAEQQEAELPCARRVNARDPVGGGHRARINHCPEDAARARVARADEVGYCTAGARHAAAGADVDAKIDNSLGNEQDEPE